MVSDVATHHTVSQEGFEPTTKGLRVPCSTAELLARDQAYRRRHRRGYPPRRCFGRLMRTAATSRAALPAYDAPILKIFVPQTGQVPCVAGRPFFIVIAFASLISREALHFTQYPVATGHLHARIERDASERAQMRAPSEAAGIVPPPYSTPQTHKTPPQGRGFVVRKGRVGKSCSVGRQGCKPHAKRQRE